MEALIWTMALVRFEFFFEIFRCATSADDVYDALKLCLVSFIVFKNFLKISFLGYEGTAATMALDGGAALQ
jgi:hypothetical protein